MTHVPHDARLHPNIKLMPGSVSTTAGRRVPKGTSLVILSLRNVTFGMMVLIAQTYKRFWESDSESLMDSCMQKINCLGKPFIICFKGAMVDVANSGVQCVIDSQIIFNSN